MVGVDGGDEVLDQRGVAEQQAGPPLHREQRRESQDHPGDDGGRAAADSAPSLALSRSSPLNAREAIRRATVKPMPAIVPLASTAALPMGGRIRPRLSRVTAQELPTTAMGLPTT